MTTKTFAVEYLNAMIAAWYGDAYAKELLSAEGDGGTGGDHSLVTATPTNRPPDRPGGFGIDPDPDTVQWEWDIDFDAAEETAWSDAVAGVKGRLKSGEYAAIKDDVAYLRAVMQDVGAPEFDRRVARVVLSMLRDEG